MKYKLGELLSLSEDKNADKKYTVDDVKGISIQKFFIDTKADMNGVSLSPYLIVKPDYFAYVTITSRNSEKLTIAHNDSNNTYIVSSSYVVFSVSKPEILDSDYLYMYFNRPEFDRFSRFNSWGSAREAFSWEDMCDITIDLPPLSVQQKYVDVYKAMLANQRAYESGLEDLKLTCTAYIERLRKEMPLVRIGDYIEPRGEKNTDLSIKLEQGINIDKQFINPQRSNANLATRVVVRKGQFAYCTQLNNENVAIAYRTGEDCVVSPVYAVFEVTKKNDLLDEYLFIWLTRSEWGRFVYWASEGSAYEFLRYENLCETKIPIPDIKIQQAIVDIYTSYTTRRAINEKLKTQIKEICPILIKGSVEEARA
jgi:type I restriction enzyme S subunit